MATKTPTPSNLAIFLSCKSRVDLAKILGTTHARLEFHLYSIKSPSYSEFKIPKANGSERQISSPPPLIQLWQRQLLPYLTALYVPKPCAHGFIPGRSIKSNASPHVNKRLILNIDIKDFFPTIHFGRVLGIFQKSPFLLPYDVSVLLAGICTNRGWLPQGAPTSPMLSNFVCRRLDNELRLLALRRGCTYTRFADDISFSTNRGEFPKSIVNLASDLSDAIELGDRLVDIVNKHDFRINKSKTRIRSNENRQEVTGLVVNKKVNVPKAFTKRLRATLDDWQKNGLAAAERKFYALDTKRKTRNGSSPRLVDHVTGKLDFLRMIRGSGDAVHTRYALIAKKLGDKPELVPIHNQASRIMPFLAEAMWVLVGRDAKGDDVVQGTSFYLHSVGFVTAAHVIDQPPAKVIKWILIQGTAPWREYEVTGSRLHIHLDLAILQTSAKESASFLVSKGEPMNGDKVTIVGYPNWHTIADELLRADTNVVQKKTLSGVSCFSVGQPLLSGNSGGPALDANGEVLGVVVNSKDNSTLPNGVVRIEHIDVVKSQPLIKL